MGIALPIESGRRSTSAGIEVRRPERLGQPVHQVRLGPREDRAQTGRASPSASGRRCWRSSAGLAVASAGQSWSASWIHSGGTHVSPVTRGAGAQSHDVAAEAGSSRARRARRRVNAVVSWLKPASKLSGSAARMTSSLVVLEVLADARCRRRSGCGGRARRPSGCRCSPTCRGSPPCRGRSRSAGGSRRRELARVVSRGWSAHPARRSAGPSPTTTTCSTDGHPRKIVAHQGQALRRTSRARARRSRRGCSATCRGRSSGLTGTKTPPAR